MSDESRPLGTVLLLRHAPVEGGDRVLWGRSPGVQLSPEGWMVAYRLARGLAEHRLQQVVASPQQRALETAAVIANVTKAALRVDPRLDEFDFGDWTGRGFTELQRDPCWQQFNRLDSRVAAPNGESRLAFQDRVSRALESLLDGRQCRVAVVTHAAVIRAALLRWMICQPAAWEAIDVPPGSVAECRRLANGWSVMQPRTWDATGR